MEDILLTILLGSITFLSFVACISLAIATVKILIDWIKGGWNDDII